MLKLETVPATSEPWAAAVQQHGCHFWVLHFCSSESVQKYLWYILSNISSMQMYWHKFLFCFLLGVDYLVCIFLSFAVLLLPSIDRGISICSFCSFPDSSLSPLSLLFSFFPSLCCCFERGQPKLKPVCCYLISKAVTLNDSIMTPSSFCLFCFVCFSPFGSPANISWHPGRVVASWWTEIF